MKKLLFMCSVLALVFATVVKPAQAEYPEKPISMIIAFTAGGSSDVQARIMQKYWNKYVPEQPWTFVYKPGAGGAIGFTEIARARPNGYTIGGANVPHVVLQPMAQGAQFSIDDFAYICQVVNDPQTITVRKDSPFNSVEEVFAYAKANPKKVKLGLVGPMSGHHLMMLDVSQKYPEMEFANIFYKGAADQNTALLGGEIDVMFGNLNDVMRSLDEFKVLAIASKERNSFLPDVPTMEEAGYPILSDIRRFFAAPKNIDPAQLEFLREKFALIGNDPQYIEDMIKAGQPHEYANGPEFEQWLREQDAIIREITDNGKLLQMR